MWSDFKYINGKSYIQGLPGYTFKGIMYMSLDCGITWNYLGEEYPTSDIWTWCSGNVESVVNYISNSLLEGGYLPIFYSVGADEAFIEKILSYFKVPPPCFIGVMPDLIHGLIVKSWLKGDKTLKDELPPLKCDFDIKNMLYYNIGPKFPLVDELIQDKSLHDLNIAHDISYIDKPCLIVLVGQQGSGKSTVAKRFGDKGWVVIDEMYVNNIKRKGSNITPLINLISNIGDKGVGSKGVVIDAPNPKESDRKFFTDIAISKNKDYIVGWITRPGYYFDSRTSVSAPINVLETYSNELEPPSYKRNGVRMI